jgi:archaetidylinositol phosphate synthase
VRTATRGGAPAASHVRLNAGIFASAEKQLLINIARRLPARVNSDHLTLLALLAMAGTGASFWLARYWPPALVLAVLCLILNWFGDSLDGTLARVRRHERPRYGYYVDHVLDVAGISLLMCGMALSGFISPLVAMSMLAAYLLVSAETYLSTAVSGTFRMSFLKVGPTELRILLALGTLMLYTRPRVAPFGLGPFLLFDVGGVVTSAGLLVAFIWSAVRGTVQLYQAEPLPKGPLEEVA